MTADNRYFDVNGESEEELALCLQLVLLLEEKASFVGFRISKELGVVLYDTPSSKMMPFLSPTPAKEAAFAVFQWLRLQPNSEFAEWGSHDGDNARGWRVHMDFWGGVDKDSDAVVAVKPTWLWLGK